MPYSSTSELPPEVKRRYSERCQRAFMHAFNSAMKREQNETLAFKIAHAAARQCEESHE